MNRKFELRCKIVTRLFMGGANSQAELRTQSINGVLRWWFRALGGSFEDEKRLFGWGGEEANQGLVRISLRNFDNLKTDIFQKIDSRRYNGISYLGFSLRQRKYIKENQTFDLIIRFHPKATDDDIKKFFSAVWCAFNLGNFGSRSRRGFGSIMVEGVSGELPEGLEFRPTQPINEWIKRNLRNIKGLIYSKPRENIPYVFDSSNFEIYKVNTANLSNLKQWIQRVQRDRRGNYLKSSWGLNNITDWMGLLDFMGFLLMAFRSYRNPDYSSAKDILEYKMRQSPTFERPIFGLPLGFYFSSLKKGGMIHLKKDGKTLRRASPLMFKILKVNNSYEGFFIVAKSRFMPENSELSFEVQRKSITVNLPQNEWNALDEFIKSLQNNGLISKIV
ncbi:MAG: type III-B CRISPR module RAMP protein Cmr1 [candidate division WOR-3 bacterium]